MTKGAKWNVIFEGKFKRPLAERRRAVKAGNWGVALKANDHTKYIIVGALTAPGWSAPPQDSWRYKTAHRISEDKFFDNIDTYVRPWIANNAAARAWWAEMAIRSPSPSKSLSPIKSSPSPKRASPIRGTPIARSPSSRTSSPYRASPTRLQSSPRSPVRASPRAAPSNSISPHRSPVTLISPVKKRQVPSSRTTSGPKSVVFAGKFRSTPKQREEVLEEMGAKSVARPSSLTSMIVIGSRYRDDPSLKQTEKYILAAKYNIPIVEERAFFELAGRNWWSI